MLLHRDFQLMTGDFCTIYKLNDFLHTFTAVVCCSEYLLSASRAFICHLHTFLLFLFSDSRRQWASGGASFTMMVNCRHRRRKKSVEGERKKLSTWNFSRLRPQKFLAHQLGWLTSLDDIFICQWRRLTVSLLYWCPSPPLIAHETYEKISLNAPPKKKLCVAEMKKNRTNFFLFTLRKQLTQISLFSLVPLQLRLESHPMIRVLGDETPFHDTITR